MIHELDAVLHRLLTTRVRFLAAGQPPTVVDGQVGFRPPNADWRQALTNLGSRRALNLYLVDLRENLELRSNEPVRSFGNGLVREEPAPPRVVCHYLLSAWSPATEQAGKSREEHRLLSEALAVLMRHRPLVPRSVYAPGPLPTGFPAALDTELPSVVTPADGFGNLAEFWESMGDQTWKPAVYLMVTVPVPLEERLVGPMVTTLTAEYQLAGSTEPGDVRIEIGGRVLDVRGPGAPRPLAGAWVGLETSTGQPLQSTTSDEDGRYQFASVTAGAYLLRRRFTGRPEPNARDIDVPSKTGEYDLPIP